MVNNCYLLVMTNSLLLNMVHLCPFIGDLPIKMLIFNSYVKLPEGITTSHYHYHVQQLHAMTLIWIVAVPSWTLGVYYESAFVTFESALDFCREPKKNDRHSPVIQPGHGKILMFYPSMVDFPGLFPAWHLWFATVARRSLPFSPGLNAQPRHQVNGR